MQKKKKRHSNDVELSWVSIQWMTKVLLLRKQEEQTDCRVISQGSVTVPRLYCRDKNATDAPASLSDSCVCERECVC